MRFGTARVNHHVGVVARRGALEIALERAPSRGRDGLATAAIFRREHELDAQLLERVEVKQLRGPARAVVEPVT